MGRLVEQVIPTFFQGVSRQPDSVRFVGQVEEAENVTFSVVDGGFSKRHGLRLRKKLSSESPGVSRRLHIINRDANHQYRACFKNATDGVRIFDQDYTERTIDFNSLGAYFAVDPYDLIIMSAVEYTFVLKKTETIEINAASPAPGGAWTQGYPRYLLRSASTENFDMGEYTMDTTTASNDGSPQPDIDGLYPNDMVIHRNRLGILAGETAYFSQAGNYPGFWPASETSVADSDPFGLTNPSNSVGEFKHAISYHRSLFIMANNAQFEAGGDAFTPSGATIDKATSYDVNTECRPVTLGDELFFTSNIGNSTAVFSYTFDQDQVSETADEVSRHVRQYIPSGATQMATDPSNNVVYILTEDEPDTLYVYTFYYQGDEKVQSSWGKYQFDNVHIRSIAMAGDVLVLLIDFDTGVWLAELPYHESSDFANFPWIPRIDFAQILVGTYDVGTNQTTWDVGYTPSDPVVITSDAFESTKRTISVSVEISGTTLVATGDYSAQQVVTGENFNAYVTLSKQYLRDKEGTSVVNGRLQLKNLVLRFTDSGYFTVTVTPYSRDAQVWTYTGRTLGDIFNLTQSLRLSTGKFRVGVNSNAETVDITIGSDRFMPFTITSGAWTGFFNEITRQG